WFALVFPMLALNYLGQASIVLSDPAAIENPFFLLFPNWSLLPIVGLTIVATTIANQAVISGAYSLVRQAVQLGLLPRLKLVHTSGKREGPIVVPLVGLILLIGCIILTIMFRSSSALASAYGMAASSMMAVTSCLVFLLIWKCWKWSRLLVAA